MKKTITIKKVFVAAAFALSFMSGKDSFAQTKTYPSGFSHEKLCVLNYPTCYTFAKDGRVFIGEQDGTVKVLKDGQLLPKPFIKIPNVWTHYEKGLIGVALDPDFETNNFVYIHYTDSIKFVALYGWNARQNEVQNKVIRVKANGDVADLSTLQNVILFNKIVNPNWNHDGGAMHFGPDKKLYISIGNNYIQDWDIPVEQNVDVYHGKIIRINSDGTAPTDNPFYEANASEAKKRVWALGMRNPYTFHFRPGTNEIFFNDVGSSANSNGSEEINRITEGGQNFGFPDAEGIANDPQFQDPVFAYPTDNTNDQNGQVYSNQKGCSITGGTFFAPSATNWPDQYKGKYFFTDFCQGWISYLDPNDSWKKALFAEGALSGGQGKGTLALETGSDGNLYFLVRSAEANVSGLYKISYSGGVGTKDAFSNTANIILFPNPAKDELTADFTNLLNGKGQDIQISIIDATSKEVLKTTHKASEASFYKTIPIHHLPKGMYHANFIMQNAKYSKKFMIE